MINTDQFKIGDLLEMGRKEGYSHWAVYAGDGEIIHLAVNDSSYDGLGGFFKRFVSKSVVKRDKLDDIAGISEVIVNNSLDGKLKAKVREETIKFAEKCLGKEGYSFLFGNCETFANMCRYGNPVSFQAVSLVKILFALDAGIAVGKLTKKFLKDKIGCFGATVVGAFVGTATAGATLCLSMTVSFLEELMITLVTDASKQVLLTVGLGAASNILFFVNIAFIIGSIVCTLYQVFTSETFKKIFSWLRESFSEFRSDLYNLVARTVSRLMSEPQ